MNLGTSEAYERVYCKCVKRDGHRLWPKDGIARVIIGSKKRDARAVVYEAHTGRRLPPYSRLSPTCGEPRCVEASHLAVIGGRGA